jgi:hypothetical protein
MNKKGIKEFKQALTTDHQPVFMTENDDFGNVEKVKRQLRKLLDDRQK